MLPGPLAPNPRVRWSRTSPWCRSSSKAHSRHRIVSLLGGNSFGFGLSICLLSFSLPISRLRPTGDLPTCGPANRNAYITCKDVGAAAGVFAPLLPFLLGSCPALQTQPGNTQHNRLAAHLNRARSLGRHWISFAAGGTNGGGGADPFAPPVESSPSVRLSLFNNVSLSPLDHFMNWAGPRVRVVTGDAQQDAPSHLKGMQNSKLVSM